LLLLYKKEGVEPVVVVVALAVDNPSGPVLVAVGPAPRFREFLPLVVEEYQRPPWSDAPPKAVVAAAYRAVVALVGVVVLAYLFRP
jgi:hypothetical protein